MKRSGLRQRCEQIVAGLDIPAPFDVSELCERLGRDRARPIRLLAAALPADSPCGMWVATDTADYIFHEQRTSRLHQEHIILHEIGHLLCDHSAAPLLDEDASRLLLPSLDPGMVRRMLGRTHYSAEEEQQAEIVASLILQRANRCAPPRGADVPADMADAVDRLARSLGQRDRRDRRDQQDRTDRRGGDRRA